MAIDPLSTATRTTKRNLLAASSAVILVKAFNVEITKLPVLGGTINSDPGVVIFALVVALIYFLLTFSLYYWIDIKDLKNTEYQNNIFDLYGKSIHEYRSRKSKKVEDTIRESVPDDFEVYISYGEIESQLAGAEWWRGYTIPRHATLNEARRLNVRVEYKDGTDSPKNLLERNNRIASAYEIINRTMFWAAWSHRILYYPKKAQLLATYSLKNSVFIIRNYLFDGSLPVVLGLAALLGAFNLLPLGWLKGLVPPV